MALRLTDIRKSFAKDGQLVRAVDGVTLQVSAGQLVAISGPSGCGKSTLLLVAGGLLRPDQGQVYWEDQPVYDFAQEVRARLRAERVGFVFQQFHLIEYLSLRDNVLAARMGMSSQAAAEAVDRADWLLEQLGLVQRRFHRPDQLSVGEKQRTALARALLNKPQWIMADEPTGNLDDDSARRVLEQLSAFVEQGGGVLLATHDARATGFCHRALSMSDGKLVAVSACDQVS